MKMTAEMIKNIKNLAEELDLNWDYEFVGVRVQELELSWARWIMSPTFGTMARTPVLSWTV